MQYRVIPSASTRKNEILSRARTGALNGRVVSNQPGTG
jgi:hypothetical protein